MSPKHTNASEADLLSQSIQGNRAAFGALYEKYLDQIYQYVYYRIGDHSEAEDLTETVFLKTWQALPKLSKQGKDITNLRAWLYRIAHNLVIDHHRTSKPSISLDQVSSLQDMIPDPEHAVQTLQESQQLAAAISQLKPNLQQVLICRFINQLTHSETAKIMDIKPGLVRVLQYRALKKLATILKKE